MARAAMMLIGAERTLLSPQQSLMHSPAYLLLPLVTPRFVFFSSIHVTHSQFTLLAVIGYGWLGLHRIVRLEGDAQSLCFGQGFFRS